MNDPPPKAASRNLLEAPRSETTERESDLIVDLADQGALPQNVVEVPRLRAS
jgi:hypothetical protein